MKKKINYNFLFLCIALTAAITIPASVKAQDEDRPKKPVIIKIIGPHEVPIITTTGRLSLEKRGTVEQFTLLDKNGESYLIKGTLVGELKKVLLDLGENNLVTVRGNQDGSYGSSCHTSRGFDSQGKKTIDSKCIRYYNLVVTRIIETKKSSEKMPQAKRDAEEEKKAMQSALSRPQLEGLTQMIQIEGKITSLNLKSAIKSMEVTYHDKNNQAINKTLLISPKAQIAKVNLKDKENPIYVDANALKIGQEIVLTYSRNEQVSEAILITITKEP